ncbi:MAG: FAD-dependent oxidoreductase [Gammaproteobacteria bacterium]|nr:FAD-dependent oxidoreductase [Gammaproteobacteria bacterium]
MGNKYYDVIVIGGGIHGVGVAQAAAAAGHSALLLEKETLACGTSSRSSKLIHGGLRYLEGMQFSLVRECLRERALLLKNAPSLVKLQPFHIPVYKDTRRRPWFIRSGLMLYSLLGGFNRASLFCTLSRDKWNDLDGLDTIGLEAVFRYYDAQTDDAALTRAVMHSAQSLGAELETNAQFIAAQLHNDGAVVQYQKNGETFTCEARCVINAAGPWVNHVLVKITPQQPPHAIDLVQGTHILINGTLTRGIYYMEAPSDRRAVFAMPWQGKTLVGTTETTFDPTADPGTTAPLEAEARYLMKTMASYFPEYRNLQTNPVCSAFSGLRVLPHAADHRNSPFSHPRETLLQADRDQAPRLLTIYGGKLTAYRATAEKCIKHFQSSLPVRKAIANTRKLLLQDPQQQ